MAFLKLNVILLAPLPIPPLPVIVMVGTSVIVFVVVMIHSSLLFCRVIVTQYTIMVTPSLGGKHSNVAITVETNTLTGTASTLTDISDNGNTHTATTKNITRISSQVLLFL
jgi:hypothetical protein